MKTSEQLDKLAPAFVLVQRQVKVAIKDTMNPFFKKSYADMSSVHEACKDALNANGFTILQFGGFAADYTPTIETMLLHDSGQYIQGSMPLSAQGDQMKDAQGNKLPQLFPPSAQDVAAATTLMRRVGMVAMVNLVTGEDDDGNSAGHKDATAARHNSQNLPQPVGAGSVPFQSQTTAPAGGGSSLRQGEKAPPCPKCNKEMRLSKYEDAQMGCFPWACFCVKPAVKVAR